ncbi:acetyl-CoA carboxylase biotin carboxyl carrier protein [Variovorax sp. SG517]|uniref:acetyl-CoA carboxylase biotin carboxyl carrier protein n=1 Tax=Variovorax sp. SG517 TaxID=2587117 RepID=UPI00159D748C|nr:acetyl-CoA carboxylase biotin carboxyl carrier protein subunit [Variovorax sp. SG517]NVM87037.1 acetyl-CoA carboxylase biotin carboxyl carrier protein [Variovorax sp. SG517]
MQDVSRLVAWLAGTDIGLLELRTPEGTLRLARQGDEIVELPQDEEEIEPVPIKAPSLGVFLHGRPLATAPLARTGARVEAGQALGLLKIGPLLLPVTAPRAGVVDGIHVADGVAVGYGTPLLDLHPL